MGNSILFNTAGSIALAVNYEIQGPYGYKFLSKEAAKTCRINAEFFVRVGDAVICVEDDVDLTEADLDTGSNFSASTTYYVYACHPLSGSAPVFKISLNSTYPSGGWTGDTSRKIGGFDTDGSGNIDDTTLWDLRTIDCPKIDKTIVVIESTMNAVTGNGTAGLVISESLNGYNLVDAIAGVHTQGVTGSTDIQIRRRRAGADADMLSTKITIGAEYFARDGVIDTANDDLATGDMLFVDVDAIHTTAPKGLSVTMTFQLP